LATLEFSMTTLPDCPLDAQTILANARALAPMIREQADAIESGRRLPEPLVEAMSRAGIFRIAMPRAWGGPEMSPLDQIELMEIIALADPSAAWCASILSDSGFYAGFLGDEVARKLFPSLDARCAGMLAPVGRAEIVSGGYRVSGHWAFGSGCLHATHLTGGCLVTQDGQPILEENGFPRWRVMIFDPADVEITDTWHVTGLAGSGSNDYSVADTFVPEEHTFHALGEPRRT
jgi:alkylation response protein AidB-like acyl-CoA dehydrogenase